MIPLADALALRGSVRRLFETLRKRGVAVRANAACCSSCSWVEFDATLARGALVAFYHDQDAESARRTGKLHIRFGVVGGGSARTVRDVGEEIAARAEDLGFVVEWNRSPDSTVVVSLPKKEVDVSGAGA